MTSKNKMLKIWKKLSEEEKEEYRNWARNNYKPLSHINGLWHPIIQLECVRMNIKQTIETK